METHLEYDNERAELFAVDQLRLVFQHVPLLTLLELHCG